MSLKPQDLPEGTNFLLFQQLLYLRDYHMEVSGAGVPRDHIKSGNCLPIAFCLHAFSQFMGRADQDVVSIEFDPQFWSMSGIKDLRTLLQNGEENVEELQKYNYNVTWSKVKDKVMLDSEATLSPNDIQWKQSPVWKANYRLFIPLLVNQAGQLYGLDTTQNIASLKTQMTGSNSKVPTLYIVENLFWYD